MAGPPPIKSVAAQKGHILRVNWASGSVTLLNMRPMLQSPRFATLRDEAVWRSVVTDGRTIRWTDAEGYTYDMAEYEVNRFADGL
ncbi:MAG: hypothetical protein ACI3XJ_06085 [Oscillospiraceae bacterium]